ncbi:helix-turn-helix domain-containing protein [Parasphingopyxis algicola]|uniref:helix-turn-helix domain-containing protein n=1 Tax=Parasphingopyxis algicola TaxID=2026624 RepID=UPI00159FB720|nr:helix-turn-helix domain-containing protein [Parasphingopyxis algicola]QLC26374.1 helix-turn-helix domain-containing protein [Parasphingopyxis algicola]
MSKGVPIRSVKRALDVLRVINHYGSLTMMEISKQAGVPYPTANRIVQTLISENYLEREPDRKRYRPTALVQTLAHGFQDHSGLVEVARPHMEELTRNLHWPVSLVTRVGEMMVVRDCTHAISPLTFDTYYPGASFPILDCASGQVYLAHCDDREREQLLAALPESGVAYNPVIAENMRLGIRAEEIRSAGYLVSGHNQFTTTPGRTSSIAVPVLHDGKIVASLVIICFANSLNLDVALEQYLPSLKNAATAIGRELGFEKDGEIAA